MTQERRTFAITVRGVNGSLQKEQVVADTVDINRNGDLIFGNTLAGGRVLVASYAVGHWIKTMVVWS